MDKNTSTLIEVYTALKELVDLKEMKEKYGETEEYLKRKPLAWAKAKRVVRKHISDARYWGAIASKRELHKSQHVSQ